MDALRYYRRLLAHNEWANRETVHSLQALDPPPQRGVQLLAHVAGAEWLWYTRVRREPPRMEGWPELTLDQCDKELAAVAEVWKRFLQSRTPDGLRHPVAYVDTSGQSWQSSVEDIMQHVVMHSAYHRAQVASEVRRAGGTPARVDFIHGVRSGIIRSMSLGGRRGPGSPHPDS